MGSSWTVDLRHRNLQSERMDQPDLDSGLHHAALKGLERVNAISRTHRTFWPAIRRLAAQHPDRPIRMLDVASGGGDVAVRLLLKARSAGVSLTIDGCDISPTALAFAQERAKRNHVDCRFFQFDVMRDDWPTDYDIIGSSLFLHHLSTEVAIYVLTEMARATRSMVVVNDLIRSRYGYWLARYVSQLLSRSPIVHSDGPASVAGAFTIDELRTMATAAGMDSATISRRWPARMLLEWTRP